MQDKKSVSLLYHYIVFIGFLISFSVPLILLFIDRLDYIILVVFVNWITSFFMWLWLNMEIDERK